MANILYIILTILKAAVIIYAGIYVARNIRPAFKSNDRKQLRKIVKLILLTFLFVLVLTIIEFGIALNG
ncbi:hypothetical protein HDC91_002001 [Mucilaginibacter sp. AK015]|nr:hypothetical protein [Mucilaginibacter sp. AK015]